MRWSRLGQCRINLEVRQHLERWTYIGWNDPRELPNSCREMEQFPKGYLHGVQTNEKTPSSSARTEGHKRWVRADHSAIWWWIHQKTWQADAEIGNWLCGSWDLALASCNSSSYGTFKSSRRCVHRRKQDFLPDEPGCGLYSWRRIPLHYIWERRPDFPRRTTSWRRWRPHQHVLRAFRALGRAEPNGAAIQKNWSDRPCLHLHDLWIHRQVLPSCISWRTHLDSTNNSFRFIWRSIVLWLEGWEVLPSHDHKRKWTDCTFCAGSKEDRNHRPIWQAHWECCSGRIFPGPEWTPQARWHQDEPHQLFQQALPWTSRLEWRDITPSSYLSSKQGRS